MPWRRHGTRSITGKGRDQYDVRGRVAHESIFNVNDGNYRCPNSQQGYSPFSTWTRGLAWAMCGFAEQLEFIETVADGDLAPPEGRPAVEAFMLEAARATCDFYIEHTPTDGVPYWDTGAPGLARMPGYLDRPADPFNEYEPVDSSAAAIAAQGLLRLGHYLQKKGSAEEGRRYAQAGLTVVRTLLTDAYLGIDPKHQGLLLHSVYHRPNGWGPYTDRSQSALWRVEYVGRLPSARGWAVCAAACMRGGRTWRSGGGESRRQGRRGPEGATERVVA